MTDTATVASIELDPVTRAWLLHARNIRAQIAEKQAELERAVEVIKDRLGDTPEATVDGVPVVSWAWSKPGTQIDRKALERDHPEIAAAYTVEKKAARPFKLLDAEAGQ